MLHYIIQVVGFQLIFLLVYDVLLKRETFFNCNRIYLLGTAVLSFLLPLVKFNSLKALQPEEFVIVLPQVFIGAETSSVINDPVVLGRAIETGQSNIPVWQIILIVGMLVALLLFVFKLIKLFTLMHKNPKKWSGNVLLVRLLRSNAAFSFFNTVFIGDALSTKEQSTILHHEMVHVKQRHSLDLLVFELLRIAMWFNPLVYLYQSRVKDLHEYIADATVANQQGKKVYYTQLLNQVFQTQDLSFTNTFFKKSLIKKRIAMLQKSKSKKVATFKYAVLLPILLAMLVYTSAEVKAQERTNKEVVPSQIDVMSSDEELIDKYYKKFKKSTSFGNYDMVLNQLDLNPDKFKMSRQEWAKYKAFSKLMQEFATSKNLPIRKDLIKQDKTYDDYLQRTKTPEYGKNWETRTKDGVLRLFVKDLKNLTSEEKKRMNEKIDFVLNDDYWEALLISDGKTSTKMLMDDISKKPNQIDVKDETKVTELANAVEVPFAVIDEVPAYMGCENLATNDERKKCTSQNIAKFVNQNFNTDLAASLGLSGRVRISVGFKINEQGDVIDVFSRAPHPELEKETRRVVKLLPKFKPGKHKGKTVTVPYALPIVFQIADKKNEEQSKTPNFDAFNNELESLKDWQSEDNVPFAQIDNTPSHMSCKNLSTNDERKKCTSQNVAKFVNQNFNMELLKTTELKGKQRIVAGFTIDEKGRVNNINVKAPSLRFKNEVKRIVALLPDFEPGTLKGKAVAVSYSLPIEFQIISGKE